MRPSRPTLNSLIADSLRRVASDPAFQLWLGLQPLSEGDVLLVNTSFLERQSAGVSTKKADTCLAIRVGKRGQLTTRASIATGFPRFNTEFKYLSVKSKNLPTLTPVGEAIQSLLSHIGEIVFVLVGNVVDDVAVECDLPIPGLSTLTWQPNALLDLEVHGTTVVIRSPEGEDVLVLALRSHLAAKNIQPPADLTHKFAVALDDIRDKALARLVLPKRGEALTARGLLDDVLAALDLQRNAYKTALGAAAADPASSTDVLRIAYNFATDALGLLRLIITVCDLKPAVQWATVGEHLLLWRALQALPWTRSRHKPSLDNYSLVIRDARNSAFHNALPFRKTLQVTLPAGSIRDAQLAFLGQFGRKSDNKLQFADDELVAALLEFRRARSRNVSANFWHLNADVMDRMLDVVGATNQALKAAREQM
jgi:hypothetical protein